MFIKEEQTEDFAFFFQALKTWEDDHHIAYEPKVLIADVSAAITNGFTNVFGSNFCRVTCWAHVNRAYQKRLNLVKCMKIRAILNDEIHQLQLCHNSDYSDQMLSPWFKKWKTNADTREFMLYFKET